MFSKNQRLSLVFLCLEMTTLGNDKQFTLSLWGISPYNA